MIAILALFFALPDMPLPKPSTCLNDSNESVCARFEPNSGHAVDMPKPFMDKPAKIAFATNISLFALDAAQTCHNLANGGHEHYLPSQSCAGTTAIMGAEIGALWLGARFAHKHNWHKLERTLEWVMPIINTKAIIYSKEHGAL